MSVERTDGACYRCAPWLERNAALIVRLRKTAMAFHIAAKHTGGAKECRNQVCLEAWCEIEVRPMPTGVRTRRPSEESQT